MANISAYAGHRKPKAPYCRNGILQTTAVNLGGRASAGCIGELEGRLLCIRAVSVDPSGFSRSPEQPYLHYVVMPSPIGIADLAAGLFHAASDSFGSLYRSPRTMMAQAILAILLASATAATLVGRRSINRASQGRLLAPYLRA